MKGKNKKFGFIFLLIIFLGIVSPFGNVALGADPFIMGFLSTICPTCTTILQLNDVTKGMVGDVANGVALGALKLIVSIPAALLEISQSLLSTVISPKFLEISMTGPDNVVVAYGWAITRDLANIFLLLGLVVIGLGIILGIEEYQAKKTLPRLIAIALLINFTLVICGFILDFANLLMNYLLGAGSLSPGLSNEIQNGIAQLAGQDLLKSLGLILTLFAFGIVAAIVYALYALLFIARYVYLWILIIIAPIAFVSKVFPVLSQAKQFFPSFFHWEEWWKSFIQWSTIGIYAAFFIALANRLMSAMASGAIAVTGLSALGSIFSYLFPLALLLIGLFSILDSGSSVSGFNKVVGYGKTALIGAGAVAAGAAAGAFVGQAKGMEQSLKAGETPLKAVSRSIYEGVKGAVTSSGRETGILEARKFIEKIPLAGRVIGGPGAADKDFEKQLNEAREENKKLGESDSAKESRKKRLSMWPLRKEDYYRRLATTEGLVEKEGLEAEENVKRHIPEYQASGANINNILKYAPGLAEYFKDKDGKQMTIREAVTKIDPEDIAKINKNSINYFNDKLSIEQKNKVKETVLVIGEDPQLINKMKNIKINLRKDFRDSLKEAIVNPPPRVTISQDSKALENLVKMTKNPAWRV